MLKKLALSSAIALVLAAPAYAQTSGTTTPAAPHAAAPVASAPAGTVDSRELIGRNIVNAQNDTVGEIEAVAMGPDGKVRNVIVGVGGFLGMGERLVAIDWNQLQIQDGGKRVVLNTTKDQLKAMPEYRYGEGQKRGSVFAWNDSRDMNRGTVATAPRPADRTDTTVARSTTSSGTAAAVTTGVATDQVNAKELIGRNIVNAQNDTVGEIESVILNSSGQVRSVVLGVGGFLGIGEKLVAVDWNQLQVMDAGKKVVMNTSKDALKSLPEYKYPSDQRRGSVFTWNDNGNRTPTSAGGTETHRSGAGTGSTATTPPAPAQGATGTTTTR